MQFQFAYDELRYRLKPADEWLRTAIGARILAASPTATRGEFLVLTANNLFSVTFPTDRNEQGRISWLHATFPGEKLPPPDYSAYQPPPPAPVIIVRQRVTFEQAQQMFATAGRNWTAGINSAGEFTFKGVPYVVVPSSDDLRDLRGEVTRLDVLYGVSALDPNREPGLGWYADPEPEFIKKLRVRAEAVEAVETDMEAAYSADLQRYANALRGAGTTPTTETAQKPLAIGMRRAYFAD